MPETVLSVVRRLAYIATANGHNHAWFHPNDDRVNRLTKHKRRNYKNPQQNQKEISQQDKTFQTFTVGRKWF